MKDIMERARIVMITGPFEAYSGTEMPTPDLGSIGRRIGSFELCGRSWADPPNDWAEFIFNTFRPVFCHMRKDADPMGELMKEVIWLTFDEVFRRASAPEIPLNDPLLELSAAQVLVICSDGVSKALLGRTSRGVISFLEKRQGREGMGKPLFLKDIDLPEGSPLRSLTISLSHLELVVLPAPSLGGRRAISRVALSEAKLEDVRRDLVRRVHAALGCDRHAIW